MMNRRAFVAGSLALGLLAVPLAALAQPALEQFRFDPPRLCLRDIFRVGFSYREFPGGLAAVKDLAMEGRWDGSGERPFRSVVTPTRDDLQPNTADAGRFESRLLHWGPPEEAAGRDPKHTAGRACRRARSDELDTGALP
jgi:hypothetical protein